MDAKTEHFRFRTHDGGLTIAEHPRGSNLTFETKEILQTPEGYLLRATLDLVWEVDRLNRIIAQLKREAEAL